MVGSVQGRVLGGRYHLDDVLGVGGMSTVWRARDQVLDRDVALKLLSGRYAADTQSRQRIRVEARAAAALAHPNVAQVHDFGETVEDGQRTPFVVMELVPGLTLEQRVAAAPLPPETVFRICAEIAAGLSAAHVRGLVHRDVKPANVILAPTGAKVVDFGIAAAANPEGAGEPEEELLGTPDYLAPERITDDAVTPASDVYSLGVLLYKLLAGRLPWAATGSSDLLDAHLHTPPAPLPPLPDIRPEVTDLVRRCLAKYPADRPTAAQVAATLAAAAGIRTVTDDLAHTVAPAATDGGPSSILIRPAISAAGHRRRRGRLAVGMIAVAAAAILAWVLIPPPNRATPAAADTNNQAGLPAVARTDASSLTPPAAQSPAAGSPPFQTNQTPPVSLPTTAAPPADNPTGTAPGPGNPAGGPAPGPTGAPTDTAVTTQPTSAAPGNPGSSKTFTSAGGTIQAGCTGTGQAELRSWTATVPYKVDSVNAGPATAATIAFKHGNRNIDMTVTCNGTTPTATTTTTTN